MRKVDKRGFTLIEILISLSIVSIVGMIFFSMANSVIRFNSKNEKDMQSIALINTISEKVTNYIRETGKIGIIGNNGFFEDVINPSKTNMIFYVRKSEVNEQIEFMKPDTYVIDKKDFKVEIIQKNSITYNDGILENNNKYLHEIEIIVTPLGISNKIQKVTKKVYGPIE